MNMNWFERLCRRTGLAVHHVVNPVRAGSRKQELGRRTEQRQLNEKVTLRRTTIEEIEVRRGAE